MDVTIRSDIEDGVTHVRVSISERNLRLLSSMWDNRSETTDEVSIQRLTEDDFAVTLAVEPDDQHYSRRGEVN